MKKALVCFMVVLLFSSLVACSGSAGAKKDPHPNMSHKENSLFATPENAVDSPSGKYTLRIRAGFDGSVYFNQFAVYNKGDIETPKINSGLKCTKPPTTSIFRAFWIQATTWSPPTCQGDTESDNTARDD